MTENAFVSPEKVWDHFHAITSIPHPSGHIEKIRDYVTSFASEHGIDHFVDRAGNVILRKPATPGLENRKGIILQAHLDMVPQNNSDKVFDFQIDAIQTVVQGDWMTADGTTLGADNGIGVAAILAVFESDEIQHGPLEALLTIDEETGMVGAFGLEPGELSGDILLNLDSEDEGELYVGCAGGLDANINLPVTTEPVPRGFVAVSVEVKGLKGGHSGMEIILQRGNSNKILFRLLKVISGELPVRLACVDGGGLRNAIPREAKAVVVLPPDALDRFTAIAANAAVIYKNELALVDPDLEIGISRVELPESVLTEESFRRLTDMVYAFPNGVYRMSDAMPGLVETSSNLARVVSCEGNVEMTSLLRSSVNSRKEDLAQAIRATVELAGGKVGFSGGYDGWNPNPDSSILKTMKENYEELYGVVPEIKAIHAGLECGIIGGQYPNLDMISFGPTIRFPHSPDEKVHIDSVRKFWELLIVTLKNAPQK